MKFLGYLFSCLLLLLGLMFCVAAASTGIWQRWVLGGILVGAALVLIAILRARVPESHVHVTQKLELTGDVHLEAMSCAKCGGALDSTSVSVRAGAVFVKCPFCRAEYQIEEEPKW